MSDKLSKSEFRQGIEFDVAQIEQAFETIRGMQMMLHNQIPTLIAADFAIIAVAIEFHIYWAIIIGAMLPLIVWFNLVRTRRIALGPFLTIFSLELKYGHGKQDPISKTTVFYLGHTFFGFLYDLDKLREITEPLIERKLAFNDIIKKLRKQKMDKDFGRPKKSRTWSSYFNIITFLPIISIIQGVTGIVLEILL